MLLLPKSFGCVEHGVYRSALPQAEHPAHLALPHLRSVVVVSPQRPHLFVLQHLAARSFAVHDMVEELMPSGSPAPFADSAVRRAKEPVLTPKELPTLMRDFSGLHEVGIVIDLVRRLHRWSLTAVLDEYRSVAY